MSLGSTRNTNSKLTANSVWIKTFLLLSFLVQIFRNIPILTELPFCDPFEELEKCVWNQSFPVILTKANCCTAHSLKGIFSKHVSLAPVLGFFSECLTFNSHAEDLIYPLVSHVPTLNPGARRTDMQNAGEKVLFSTFMEWFAWAREVRETLTYSYNGVIDAVFIDRDLQEIISGQRIERSNLNFYMQGTVK